MEKPGNQSIEVVIPMSNNSLLKNHSRTILTILILIISSNLECISAASYSLPISERPFLLGVVPIPRNFPNFSQEDLIDAYEMAGEIAEVVPVHDPQSWIEKTENLKKNRIIEVLKDRFNLIPIISLGIMSVQSIDGKPQIVIEMPPDMPSTTTLKDAELRRRWVEEAVKIAREFKPQYLQLGNEINFSYEVDPKTYEDYVSLYKEAYDAVKKTSPNTKIFTVFSYNHLVSNSRWHLIRGLEGKYDLLGLNTYPWMVYGSPAEMPDNYYKQIETYTDKPVAFNEIGWGSSPDHGGSEKEQVDFLIKFLELTDGMKTELVNWLLLHDLSPQVVGKIVQPQHVSLGLRRNNGEAKPVYDAWKELKALPYTGEIASPGGIGPGVIVVIGLILGVSLCLIYIIRRIRRRRRRLPQPHTIRIEYFCRRRTNETKRTI
jgi:hypothetical protein